jgi:hypothetical protein
MLVYFCRGSLPWQGLRAATEDERNELVKEKKIHTPIEDLCHGLPDAFPSYFKHVQSLNFDDRPNYSHLRKLFRNLFIREGLQYDHVFDWTIKKFSIMHGAGGEGLDQPAQTRTSKRGAKKDRHDIGDPPSAVRLPASSAQLTRPRRSKGSPTTGRLRRKKARKARQA